MSILGSHPKVSDPVGLRWASKFGMSNKSPDYANVSGPI